MQGSSDLFKLAQPWRLLTRRVDYEIWMSTIGRHDEVVPMMMMKKIGYRKARSNMDGC